MKKEVLVRVFYGDNQYSDFYEGPWEYGHATYDIKKVEIYEKFPKEWWHALYPVWSFAPKFPIYLFRNGFYYEKSWKDWKEFIEDEENK